MARVNVFLKDELLDEINEEAKGEGTNRSALIHGSPLAPERGRGQVHCAQQTTW